MEYYLLCVCVLRVAAPMLGGVFALEHLLMRSFVHLRVFSRVFCGLLQVRLLFLRLLVLLFARLGGTTPKRVRRSKC